MTILEAMTARTLAEFDAMVAEQAKVRRASMRATGFSPAQIDAYIASCEPGLAEHRAEIERQVTVELIKTGVPLEVSADAWN